MSKPKVLRTMTWLAPGGGVDEQVKLSILGMSDEFEFHLLTGREIQNRDLFDIPSLNIHICKWLVPNFNPILDLCALLWIKRFLSQNRFNLIHTHETKSSFLTRLALKTSSLTPLIYGIHGVVFNDPRSKLGNFIYEFLERSTIGRANQIVSVSQDVQSEYYKRNIGNKLPWEIIYSGVDVEKFAPKIFNESDLIVRACLGIRPDDLVLINIGRFSISKNQKETILAFNELCKQFTSKRVFLILIGEGPLKSTCMSLCDELGISDRVKFIGFEKDIQRYLLISDLHVISSLREGLPRVAVEASLLQVPTVGYQVEGISEIVENGFSGIIVPQGDVYALSVACLELLTSDNKRKEFGTRAGGIALSKWNHNIMNVNLRKLYWNLMKGVRSGI